VLTWLENFFTEGAANILDIAGRTVVFHKSNIMEKLGIRTTAELTRYAF